MPPLETMNILCLQLTLLILVIHNFVSTIRNTLSKSVLIATILHPEKICTTGRDESELISVGTGEGVWIQDGPIAGNYLMIPDLREDALASGWSNNNCFGGMGTKSKVS